jgi:hypothetical protein
MTLIEVTVAIRPGCRSTGVRLERVLSIPQMDRATWRSLLAARQ